MSVLRPEEQVLMGQRPPQLLELRMTQMSSQARWMTNLHLRAQRDVRDSV